ncbi:MAG: putative lipid II flippase FtsW, partial [Spirochaetes bacterium]|nr:putative lipid II flippase FtsW [Spirochaetota bacterium]
RRDFSCNCSGFLKNTMKKEQNAVPSINIILLACIVLLIGIGFGFLYSASQPSGIRYYNNQFYFIFKQGIYLIIGLIFFFIGLFFNHKIYQHWIKYIVLGTIVLLVLTLIPGIGKEVGGARRWIALGGFRFQPSEMAKMTVILYLSSFFANKKEHIDDFYKGVLPAVVISFTIAFFIFLENDFSTTFLIIAVSMIMLYLAGIRLFSFILLGMVGAAGSLLMIILAPYRIQRMFAFINPWNDPLGSGWHYIQSMKCFSLGGWFGQGIGESIQKYNALPEAHNDYIFAIIAEEGGAFLAIILIILYTLFSFIGYNIAKRTDDKFSFLLAVGITTTIYIQAIINIGVVLSILPATGITLPFVSAGGTSLLVSLFMIGVLLNISSQNKHKEL